MRKKQLRKGLFVLFLGLFSFPLISSGQTKNRSTEIILQKVQSVYETAEDLSAPFTQKIKISSLDREVQKTGKLFFKKPGKFVVDYEGEDGRLYQSDGKKLWIYERGDKQVEIYPVNRETIPEETLSFLSGLGNLKAQFKVKGLSQEEQKKTNVNRELDWLLLEPKNPESNLDELLLGFEKKGALLTEAYLKNESGNVSHYLFTEFAINRHLEDSLFIFVKPKGVREIHNK